MTTYAILNDAFFAIRPRWMPAKLYQAVRSRARPTQATHGTRYRAVRAPRYTCRRCKSRSSLFRHSSLTRVPVRVSRLTNRAG